MKAILIIDVNERDIGKEVDYISVQGDGYSYIVGTMGMDARLRPLPSKLDANDWHRMFSGTFNEREAKGYGWNACLDEITGETE